MSSPRRSFARHKSPVLVAPLASVVGRRNFRPFLECDAADVAIIDLLRNGWSEALNTAAMVESFEVRSRVMP
jgi:galactonate dehydratase